MIEQRLENSITAAPDSGKSAAWLQKERLGLALLLLIFIFFTWRGMTMFFSGDDMMNMYRAWDMSVWQLAQAQVMLWMPVYRPVGDAIYRLFYEVFGFNPAPLYGFCWILLAANVIAAYRVFRAVTSPVRALTSLSLILVHGSYSDLYYSAGTIYDRLWFLFTALALAAFFRFRSCPNWRGVAFICLCSALAMGSKESGITLLAILICCECLFFAPRVWSSASIARWAREAAPLFASLTMLSLIFLFGRVHRTPGFLTNPSYLPTFGVGIWLTHVGDYFRILTYQHLDWTPATTAMLLGSMGVMAMAMRSRAMALGFLMFVISITPVALIPLRPGYVLYVPTVGLGLFFGEVLIRLTSPLARWFPQISAVTFLMVTAAMTVVHARNWPPAWQSTPESRLSGQFRRELPTLPPNSKLLFVTDDFPADAWDLIFNIRLLYRDKSIIVHRMNGAYGQRPPAEEPLAYDHLFSLVSGTYVELDPQNAAESIRLNILRKYTVGSEMDMTSPDHIAYVVFGLEGQNGEPCRWTAPHARFKFKPGPAAAVFATKFWLPDFVADTKRRTLSIFLAGREIGTVPLTQPGMNEASFPLGPNTFRVEDYAVVDLNVANPYKDAEGFEYGLLLCRAGFEPLRDTTMH